MALMLPDEGTVLTYTLHNVGPVEHIGDRGDRNTRLRGDFLDADGHGYLFLNGLIHSVGCRLERVKSRLSCPCAHAIRAALPPHPHIWLRRCGGGRSPRASLHPPFALQPADLVLDGTRALKPNRSADLPERRRVRRRAVPEELQDLLPPLAELVDRKTRLRTRLGQRFANAHEAST